MKKREPLRPGDHVRTPDGLAWVNVPPTGMRLSATEVFIRLSDDSTRRIEAGALEQVDF